ncbi:MAG: YdbH domain-containing protein [Desulfovibrionaceae bacterium]|nr:YdbH domain-containing protein [Desulfovibrionaceae bacterium]
MLILPWVLALTLAAGWGLSVWTPRYLETLVPKLAADMGLALTEFRIRDAGLFSADIGPVRLGGEDGVRLYNVHVTYTPASLRMGRVNSVELDGINLSCAFDGKKFSLPVLDLLPKSEGDAGSGGLPALPLESIVIRDAVIHCDIKGTRLSVPFSARVTPGKSYGFSASLTPRDQRVDVSGTLGPTADDLAVELVAEGFSLGAVNDFLPAPMTGRLDLDVQSALNLSDPHGLAASFTLALADADLSALGVGLADDAVIKARGRVEEKEIIFSLDPVAVASPIPATASIASGWISEDSLFAQFDLEGAGVEMGGRLEADREGDLWDVSLTAVNTDNLTVNAAGRAIHLAGFTFSLAGKAGTDRADMVLDCSTKGAALGNFGFRSGSLRLTLPLMWPAPERHAPGSLRLSGLRFKDRRLGSVTASVRQRGTGLDYSGTLFTELLPGLRIPFSGLSSMTCRDASLEFAVNGYTLPADFNPAALDPSLKGLVLSGRIDAEGLILADANGMESHLKALFSNGGLSLTEGTTSITGIRLAVESPDLLSMRTAPAQKLTFDTLSAGNIAITNGEISYQIEPGGVVLVEDAGFKWAGGHVSSRAFRIRPGSNEYALTLFCSNLKLSAILAQLGLARAEGEAAMSGELPVTWKHGKISFSSGFLHSTPGEGGVIQVEALEDLAASIPEGTVQRGQIELAREAVRDFEYKWVRIKADTVGEDLLVRLSLDGKPRSTLPFVYRREFGGFLRVTGDVKGSNFQGLRLDVNFSVPLDRILLYKDIVNMIE